MGGVITILVMVMVYDRGDNREVVSEGKIMPNVNWFTIFWIL